MHLAHVTTLTSWHNQGVSGAQSLHPHAIHDVICLSVRLLSLRLCLPPVYLSPLPFLFHCLPVLCPAHQFSLCRHHRGFKTTALTYNEEYCPVAIYNPLTCQGRSGQPFKGPIIPFGSLVEYHPITAKDQSRIHQFGKKVLPGMFLGYALYARELGKVTYFSHTLISWRRWTHRKSTRKDSMRKR